MLAAWSCWATHTDWRLGHLNGGGFNVEGIFRPLGYLQLELRKSPASLLACCETAIPPSRQVTSNFSFSSTFLCTVAVPSCEHRTFRRRSFLLLSPIISCSGRAIKFQSAPILFPRISPPSLSPPPPKCPASSDRQSDWPPLPELLPSPRPRLSHQYPPEYPDQPLPSCNREHMPPPAPRTTPCVMR